MMLVMMMMMMMMMMNDDREDDEDEDDIFVMDIQYTLVYTMNQIGPSYNLSCIIIYHDVSPLQANPWWKPPATRQMFSCVDRWCSYIPVGLLTHTDILNINIITLWS